MKKTMLALMATVGLAFGAKAVLPTTTGFEGSTGSLSLTDEWSAATTNGLEATDLACVVTNYADKAKPTNLPGAFADAGNNYLAVDTSGAILYRNVNDRTTTDTTKFGAAAAIGGGLFFDSDVQFTATDSTGTPEPTAGDKLIVWLSADDEAGTTNLVVTASTGYTASASDGAANYTNSNTNISVKDNEWHRLTVAAATEGTVTTFKVYVDGKQVTADGVTDGKFLSLVGSEDDSEAYNTLTAVGFMGTGAIDNLVWAAGDPFPVVEPDAFTVNVTLTDDDYQVGEWTLNDEDKTGETEATADILVDAEAEIKVTLTVYTAVTVAATVDGVDVPAENITSAPGEEDSTVYTITIDGSSYVDDVTVELAIKVTADEEPTPSEDTEVVPGGEAKTTTEEAAKAVVVKAPEGSGIASDTADYTTYSSYFTQKVTGSGSDWTTTFELNETGTNTLQEAANTALTTADTGVLAKALTLSSTTAEATAKVTITKGFYWTLATGSALGTWTYPAGTLSTGAEADLTVKKPDLGKGFYKLIVSPQPIEAKAE